MLTPRGQRHLPQRTHFPQRSFVMACMSGRLTLPFFFTKTPYELMALYDGAAMGSRLLRYMKQLSAHNPQAMHCEKEISNSPFSFSIALIALKSIRVWGLFRCSVIFPTSDTLWKDRFLRVSAPWQTTGIAYGPASSIPERQ